jgi:UDP-N-acetylglucosamine acyltransferase
MAYVHVAHDVVIGDHTILANTVQIAGHAVIGDWVVAGGASAIHQFCRVGAHAMIGGGTILLQDLPPFVMCGGRPTAAHGINVEGLKRRGFDADALAALRRAFKLVYRDGNTVAEACAALDELAAGAPASAPHLAALRDFISAPGRGIVR